MFVGPRCRRDLCSVLMSTLHRAKDLDTDRMDRRKCRQEGTAALLAAEVRIGRGFRQMTFSIRAPLSMRAPPGAWRRMPSSPGFTCPLLHPTLPALSVRCTMTLPPMYPD